MEDVRGIPMLLKICDILNTIFQAFLFIWVCNNIVPKNNKISKIKLSILFTLIFSDVVLFTYSGINPNAANLFMMIVVLLMLIAFYRKTVTDAFAGFFMTYFLIAITSHFIVTIYQYYFSKLDIKISTELKMFIFVYLPVFLFYPLFYRIRKYIFSIGMFLRSLRHSLIILQIMTYALIFINTLYVNLITKNINPILQIFLYFSAFMIFIFTAVYFANIHEKSKEVEALNEALNNKIIELKKIKHDHGSEISSIYGLYQLGNTEKLGEFLKAIVERNQIFTSAVNVDMKSNPLITSVLNSAIGADINVVNLDDADYENLPLTDDELMKLVANIVKNSIDALANVESPIIKYNSYGNSEGVTIIISNNGPDIPQEIRNNIFETGFSTKSNSNGDRGFGLSIVMDILNKYNGRISIRNKGELVQFVITIPYKTAQHREICFEKSFDREQRGENLDI
jgi:two-component system, LytTR family, sensor histidine kinase AgrC